MSTTLTIEDLLQDLRAIQNSLEGAQAQVQAHLDGTAPRGCLEAAQRDCKIWSKALGKKQAQLQEHEGWNRDVRIIARSITG